MRSAPLRLSCCKSALRANLTKVGVAQPPTRNPPTYITLYISENDLFAKCSGGGDFSKQLMIRHQTRYILLLLGAPRHT
jgi:hypothetical protein